MTRHRDGDLRERWRPSRSPARSQRHREHMRRSAGAASRQLEGTYPFTLERSVKAFRLNKFLHGLIEPEYRKQLPAPTRAALRGSRPHRRGARPGAPARLARLIHYGVIFFMLEKLGAVVGMSNLHIYAAMRGQSLEDFQKTRNAQVLYSVAGQDGDNSRGQEAQGGGDPLIQRKGPAHEHASRRHLKTRPHRSKPVIFARVRTLIHAAAVLAAFASFGAGPEAARRPTPPSRSRSWSASRRRRDGHRRAHGRPEGLGRAGPAGGRREQARRREQHRDPRS